MIHIKNSLKNRLPIKDYSTLHIVADFDRTITKGNSFTSWSILANSDLVPKNYVIDRQKLYDYYRPFEIDENLDDNTKNSLMLEWYQKHIELFIKYQLKEDIIIQAAKNIKVMEFRDGAKEFLKFLYENSIPLIIISAGIGNFIKCFLENNDCYFSNIHIISNMIEFKNGIAIGVGKNIIHSLNKNKVSFTDDINVIINNKENIILLGDQISDIKMVDSSKKNKTILTGFLSDDSIQNLDKFIEEFDIVCENSNTYIDLMKILF